MLGVSASHEGHIYDGVSKQCLGAPQYDLLYGKDTRLMLMQHRGLMFQTMSVAQSMQYAHKTHMQTAMGLHVEKAVNRAMKWTVRLPKTKGDFSSTVQ